MLLPRKNGVLTTHPHAQLALYYASNGHLFTVPFIYSKLTSMGIPVGLYTLACKLRKQAPMLLQKQGG